MRAGDLVVGYESSPIQARRRPGPGDQPSTTPTATADEALTLEPVAEVDNGVTYEELQDDPCSAESEPARFRCQGHPVRAERGAKPTGSSGSSPSGIPTLAALHCADGPATDHGSRSIPPTPTRTSSRASDPPPRSSAAA